MFSSLLLTMMWRTYIITTVANPVTYPIPEKDVNPLKSVFLEYCSNNLRLKNEPTHEHIELNHPRISQKVRGCLDRCEQCKLNPFVIVNRPKKWFGYETEVLEASDTNKLIEAIEKELKANQKSGI